MIYIYSHIALKTDEFHGYVAFTEYCWWLMSNLCWVYQEDPLISQGHVHEMGETVRCYRPRRMVGPCAAEISVWFAAATWELVPSRRDTIPRDYWWSLHPSADPWVKYPGVDTNHFQKTQADTEIDSETHKLFQDVFLRFRHGDGDANLGCVFVWPQWK